MTVANIAPANPSPVTPIVSPLPPPQTATGEPRDPAPARSESPEVPAASSAMARTPDATPAHQYVLPENTVTKMASNNESHLEVSFAARLTPMTPPAPAALDPTIVLPSKSDSLPALPSPTPAPQGASEAKPADTSAPESPRTPAAPAEPQSESTTQHQDTKPQPAIDAQIAPPVPPTFSPMVTPTVQTQSDPAQQPTAIKISDAPVASDALRASEVQPAAPAATIAPSAGPTQEISVRLSQPAAPAVDLHVTERGGEIHVSVRTPDAALETSLRQNLPTLTNSLERAGYHAETFVPQASSSGQTSTRKDAESSHPDWSGRGNSGNGSQNGRQQQQPREQREKSWIEALENAQ